MTLQWSNVTGRISNESDHTAYQQICVPRGYTDLGCVDLCEYLSFETRAPKVEITTLLCDHTKSLERPRQIQLLIFYSGPGRKRDCSIDYLETYTPADVEREAADPSAQVLLGPTSRPVLPNSGISQGLGDIEADVLYVLNCCTTDESFRGGASWAPAMGLPVEGMAHYLHEILSHGKVMYCHEVCAALQEKYISAGGWWEGLHPVANVFVGSDLGSCFASLTAAAPLDALPGRLHTEVMLHYPDTLSNEAAGLLVRKVTEAVQEVGGKLTISERFKTQGTMFLFSISGPAGRWLACLHGLGFAAIVRY